MNDLDIKLQKRFGRVPTREEIRTQAGSMRRHFRKLDKKADHAADKALKKKLNIK